MSRIVREKRGLRSLLSGWRLHRRIGGILGVMAAMMALQGSVTAQTPQPTVITEQVSMRKELIMTAVSPLTQYVGVGGQVLVTVQVKDKMGNPTAGVAIVFKIPAGYPGTLMGGGNQATVATGGDGKASVTLTAGPDPVEHRVTAEAGTAFPEVATGCTTFSLTVIKVKFNEDVQYSGYDDSVSPNWIMAPKSGGNTALAEITPSPAATQVNFESGDTAKATVSPAAASTSPQRITVSGAASGETEVHAKVGTLGAASSTLRVTTKARVNRTIAIHAITEDNDDVQAIPIGKGQAGQECITAGTNGALDSAASGDDVVLGTTVTTGPDGICNTTASGDDVQAVSINKGRPNVECVTKGANQFRDTDPSGDDIVNGNSIDTGANGICDTAASSVDIVPYNVPTAVSLKTYLDELYGRQANVFFTVTRSDYELNYDLDRNGGVPDPPNESEMDAIASIAASAGVDANIYFVRIMDVPIATARTWRQDAFVQSATGGTAENVAAHELGHFLGLSHNDTEAINVMHSSSENGRQLQKFEWDGVNP